MTDGGIVFSHSPQAFGQTTARPHVRSGIQVAPEVTGILIKTFRAKGSFTGFHSFLIELQRLLGALSRFFGQQHPSISTVRGYFQSFFHKFNTFYGVRRLPGVVYQFLGLV